MAADIHQSTISMESAAPKRPSPSRKRRKILHTCTISMLATADRASLKATMLHGPLGFLLNRVIQFITTKGPFVGLYRFQTHLILAIMSFLDDRILKVENVVEDHFPPSSYVFDKIDDVVCFTESLPTKLDEAVDKFSGVVNKYPLRDGFQKILDLVILLRSVLAAWWGSDFAMTKERDIMVDTNCSENSQRMTKRVVCDEAVCQIEPPVSMSSHTTSLPEQFHKSEQTQELEKKTLEDKNDEAKEEASSDRLEDGNGVTKNTEENVPKCSYKEVLEKGNSYKELFEKGNTHKELDEKGSSYKEVLLEKGSSPKEVSETGSSYKEVLEKGNSPKEVAEKGTSYKEVLEKGTKEESKEQTKEATKDNNSRGDVKILDSRNDPILELFESAWHMT